MHISDPANAATGPANAASSIPRHPEAIRLPRRKEMAMP